MTVTLPGGLPSTVAGVRMGVVIERREPNGTWVLVIGGMVVPGVVGRTAAGPVASPRTRGPLTWVVQPAADTGLLAPDVCGDGRTGVGARGSDPRSGVVVRRRPTLPLCLRSSTIGAERLSFRVRNGTGRFPLAMAAVTLCTCQPRGTTAGGVGVGAFRTAQWTRDIVSSTGPPRVGGGVVVWSSPRPVSTGRLHTSRCFHLRPINPLV